MCTQHARFEGHTWCRRAERPPGAGFSHHYCIWLHIQWSLTASNSHQNQASPIACKFWCFSINAGLYFRNVLKFDFCLNRHNNRNMQNLLFCCTIIDKPFNTAYISANTLLCCKFLLLFIFNWFAFQQQYENKIYFQKDLETNWFSNETVFLCVAVRMNSYLIVPVGEGRGLIILLKSFFRNADFQRRDLRIKVSHRGYRSLLLLCLLVVQRRKLNLYHRTGKSKCAPAEKNTDTLRHKSWFYEISANMWKALFVP